MKCQEGPDEIAAEMATPKFSKQLSAGRRRVGAGPAGKFTMLYCCGVRASAAQSVFTHSISRISENLGARRYTGRSVRRERVARLFSELRNQIRLRAPAAWSATWELYIGINQAHLIRDSRVHGSHSDGRLLQHPRRRPAYYRKMKITPVLMVEEIEKSLPFWIDRLGFAKTVEVPEGDRLGFTILVRDGAEIMLQSFESIRKDVPQFAPKNGSNNVGLFVEIEDFSDILQRLEGYPIALPERTTFYGMREIGVHEPSGHVVIFAAGTSS